jgi:hypothetical protein
MPDIKTHMKTEARKLPVTLCKLAGGLMAVIGFAGVFIILFRTPQPTLGRMGPYLAAGILGLLIFGLLPKLCSGHDPAAEPAAPAREKLNISLVAWALLMLFILLCILLSYMMLL